MALQIILINTEAIIFISLFCLEEGEEIAKKSIKILECFHFQQKNFENTSFLPVAQNFIIKKSYCKVAHVAYEYYICIACNGWALFSSTDHFCDANSSTISLLWCIHYSANVIKTIREKWIRDVPINLS